MNIGTRKIVAVSLIALGLGMAGGVRAGDNRSTKVEKPHTEVLPAFDEMDADGDGKLGVPELKLHMEIMEHFSEADVDKDRTLNREEYSSIHLESD